MTSDAAFAQRTFLAWPLRVACLLAATWVISGCAGTGAHADRGSNADVVTESDETPERKRARIRMELALGYFEQGQTNVALDELKQVIAGDPTYPQAYNLRGLIYMRLNDLRLADESFRRAVALAPKDGDTLHNYGWLMCQQRRFDESFATLQRAMENPTYGGRAKTLLALGVCQARAGRTEDAERSLARAYELDAANPVTGFNLARLLYQRGELTRAQFYIRRLNNSEFANAETLWLGVKVERRVGDRVAMNQLADQLRKRYAQSPEAAAFAKGAFDE
ncbi:MAG TPA: type IV pilus biogenesis/stability protein PilW [Ramlibacter sp.]|nr:type IV pilus biogenesis/stability protein PilW [Ramlibacter sp.]